MDPPGKISFRIYGKGLKKIVFQIGLCTSGEVFEPVVKFTIKLTDKSIFC